MSLLLTTGAALAQAHRVANGGFIHSSKGVTCGGSLPEWLPELKCSNVTSVLTNHGFALMRVAEGLKTNGQHAITLSVKPEDYAQYACMAGLVSQQRRL